MKIMSNQDTTSSKDGSSYGSEVDTDGEDAVDVGLKTRKQQRQFSGVNVPGLTKADNEEPSENITYLDKYGGAIEDLNIQKIMNSVQYASASNNGETETAVKDGREATKAKSEQIEEEIMEEEVVELEFEKAIPKLHTHTMHCPKCDQQITKVTLRRKIIKKQPPVTTEQAHKPVELLGCFSCFSLFTPKDNGGFNPFRIWDKPTSGADSRADGNGVVSGDENCLSIFRVFRPQPEKIDQDLEQPQLEKIDQDSEHPKPIEGDHPSLPIIEIKDVLNKLPIRQGGSFGLDVEEQSSKPEYQPPANGGPSDYNDQPRVKAREQDGPSIIDIPDSSPATQVPTAGLTSQDSTSFEILKSIVYGGLMEVIASLSIVASASAGDTTTLNIIALALANLIGGIFIIGHNLWDLRNDCYKFSTQQTSNEQDPRNKYKELLGSVDHFPLHAFFAILSFLVFGIIPPVVYGYSFIETNDKDFTMVIVAVTSFVCVALLAIFKAYTDRCTGFSGYVKTIMYYLATAVTVSGVSYAAGNLAQRLIEELGLFQTSFNVATAVLPEVVSMNPSLAYY